jgi:hypothetical protein
VLSPTPLVLPLVLTTNERTDVLGESTSVRLVMRNSVPAVVLSNRDTLASETRGSGVRVLVQTTDGLQKQLMPPLMGWRSSGVILSKNELSACASASCDARLPKGSVAKRIEISSESEHGGVQSPNRIKFDAAPASLGRRREGLSFGATTLHLWPIDIRHCPRESGNGNSCRRCASC